MAVLNPQEVSEGFCMDLKVRTIHNLSFMEYPYEMWLFNSEYRFICQSAHWSNFQQSLLCWTYWVIVDSTEIKVKQKKKIRYSSFACSKWYQHPCSCHKTIQTFSKFGLWLFPGKMPSYVLRQPITSITYVLSSYPIQVEEKYS